MTPGNGRCPPRRRPRRRRGRARALGAALLALALAGCAGFVEVAPAAPLTLPPPPESGVVVAADGSVLANLRAEQDRDVVPLERIPQVLRDAVVTVEDRRFRSHAGVDARAVARALAVNLQEGRVAQGGSTITQQLAKNTVTGSERTVRRKLAEASVALQLEAELSKDEILERYLNTVYFGNGAWGVQVAARRYFGVDVEAVDLAQAALLAGVLRAPAAYDPHAAPEAAKARRDVVIDLMAAHGLADPATAQAARAAPLGVVPVADERWRAPHFVAHVLDELQHAPQFAALGAEPRARADRLYRGGLRVETTLDPAWQTAAEAAVAEVLTEPGDPRAAVVAIDPASGSVRALVGGRDFHDAADPTARFNLATQARRQPASTFKSLVLAAALTHGRRLDDVVAAPARLILPPRPPQHPEAWEVDNYGGQGFGRLTLLRATALSVNTVYAGLVDEVGAEQVVDLAERAGVGRPLPALRSVALGAVEVSPLELASVQATLAAGGVHRPPSVVTRILDAGGRVLWERGEPAGERVLDEAVTAATTTALAEVVAAGTGRAAALGRPVAGKTGTSQEGADAWFAGYTPDLAAAVWVGFPEGRVPMTPPRTRIVVEGGTWPAEIFARFGLRALAGTPASAFPAAPGPPTPQAPDVVGLAADGAERALARAGFRVQRRVEHTLGLPPGYVVRQDPAPGPVADGQRPPTATVWLSVTSRVSEVVPDVLNADADDARAELEAAGFVVEVVHACPGPEPAVPACTGARRRPGRVWQQEPDAAIAAPQASVVRLSAYPGR